jgi:hypothetical protein
MPGGEVLLVCLELVSLQVVVAQYQAEGAPKAAKEGQRRFETRPVDSAARGCAEQGQEVDEQNHTFVVLTLLR